MAVMSIKSATAAKYTHNHWAPNEPIVVQSAVHAAKPWFNPCNCSAHGPSSTFQATDQCKASDPNKRSLRVRRTKHTTQTHEKHPAKQAIIVLNHLTEQGLALTAIHPRPMLLNATTSCDVIGSS